MSSPKFEVEFDNQVCKLWKFLYRLEQSSRAWFDRFTTFIKSQGYNQGHTDHTLFTKVSKTGKIVVLIVYVDDIALSEDDTIEIIQLKKKMEDEFEIKDLGNLKYFLGMEVARSREDLRVPEKIRDKILVDKEKYQFNKNLRYLKATPGNELRFMKTNIRCIEAIPTLTEQGLSLIENPPQDIAPFCGTILLLEEVRSKESWLEAALKPNKGLSLGICEEVWL
ncbi:putative mitochondrial protein [Cucumis melo var. makuwa]|uniref:Mitochondrial protein n=1 Tax=Cucumis melo var. makuwa TaxID=1194695 RepID=A0A5A7UWA9_CUCMM|nr:putative mitochondrial protein [Cucumis melo var. makuwa]